MKRSRLDWWEEAIIALAVWLSLLATCWQLRTPRHGTGGQRAVVPTPL